MRTAYSLAVSYSIQWGRVCPTTPAGCRPPLDADPWMQTRLDTDPPDADPPMQTLPSGCRHPLWMQIPPLDTDPPLDADPPLSREQTDGCKNTTFRKLCLRAVNIYQFIDIFEVIMCSKIHFLNLVWVNIMYKYVHKNKYQKEKEIVVELLNCTLQFPKGRGSDSQCPPSPYASACRSLDCLLLNATFRKKCFSINNRWSSFVGFR